MHCPVPFSLRELCGPVSALLNLLCINTWLRAALWRTVNISINAVLSFFYTSVNTVKCEAEGNLYADDNDICIVEIPNFLIINLHIYHSEPVY